jgi:hypothetical protein
MTAMVALRIFSLGVASELDKLQPELAGCLARAGGGGEPFPGPARQSRRQTLVVTDNKTQPIEATSFTLDMLDIPHSRMCVTSFRGNHFRKLSIRGVVSHRDGMRKELEVRNCHDPVFSVS